jgi:transcriptional regulator
VAAAAPAPGPRSKAEVGAVALTVVDMLQQRLFAIDDVAELRRLVHTHAWATLVSDGAGAAPVVSHFPLLLDPDRADLTLLGHLALADAAEHDLGRREVVVIVQGPHGYVSPTWYEAGPYVPTWNFVVVHLYGRPEILDEDATYEVLERTVDRFESERPAPWRLDSVPEYAASLAPHVTGFRLAPDRVVGKAKLSQDKPADVYDRVVSALDSDPVHGNPSLAAAMRRHG